MAPADEPRTAPPAAQESPRDDNFGCFALVLVVLVLAGTYGLFERAGPGGSLGAGIASLGLALLGFGIVWVAGRRRG
jgi:hypothetical protein